jgi:hypothetical protein
LAPQYAIKSGSAILIGDYIHIFSANNRNVPFYKFNTITQSFEKTTASCSEYIVDGWGAAYQDVDKVIVLWNAYRFDYVAPQDPLIVLDNLQIIPTSSSNIFNLINTDTIKAEIGVKAVFKGNADNIGEQVEAALHNGTNWVTI